MFTRKGFEPDAHGDAEEDLEGVEDVDMEAEVGALWQLLNHV